MSSFRYTLTFCYNIESATKAILTHIPARYDPLPPPFFVPTKVKNHEKNKQKTIRYETSTLIQ
jgi:hypothetical protein